MGIDNEAESVRHVKNSKNRVKAWWLAVVLPVALMVGVIGGLPKALAESTYPPVNVLKPQDNVLDQVGPVGLNAEAATADDVGTDAECGGQEFYLDPLTKVGHFCGGTFTVSAVDEGVTVSIDGDTTLVLNSATIDATDAGTSAISITPGKTLKLMIGGTSTLKSADGHAGIHVPEGATLMITPRPSYGPDPVLNVTGGNDAAGIGSNKEENKPGTVKILGATVIATGGSSGAGIGGGDRGDGGAVTISGGNVTAQGGNMGAGIGGGYYGDGGAVEISGGKVIAKGLNQSAGIGGGRSGDGGVVRISGGTVTAEGGRHAAGIGGGKNADGGMVTLSGGEVEAIAGQDGGAAVGKGEDGKDDGTVTINGPVKVTAADSEYEGVYNRVTVVDGDQNPVEDVDLRQIPECAWCSGVVKGGNKVFLSKYGYTVNITGVVDSDKSSVEVYGNAFDMPEKAVAVTATLTQLPGPVATFALTEQSEDEVLVQLTSDIELKPIAGWTGTAQKDATQYKEKTFDKGASVNVTLVGTNGGESNYKFVADPRVIQLDKPFLGSAGKGADDLWSVSGKTTTVRDGCDGCTVIGNNEEAIVSVQGSVSITLGGAQFRRLRVAPSWSVEVAVTGGNKIGDGKSTAIEMNDNSTLTMTGEGTLTLISKEYSSPIQQGYGAGASFRLGGGILNLPSNNSDRDDKTVDITVTGNAEITGYGAGTYRKLSLTDVTADVPPLSGFVKLGENIAKVGDTVTVTAAAAPSGKRFVGFAPATVDFVRGGVFNVVSFEMPEDLVTVSAVYADWIPVVGGEYSYVYGVKGGDVMVDAGPEYMLGMDADDGSWGNQLVFPDSDPVGFYVKNAVGEVSERVVFMPMLWDDEDHSGVYDLGSGKGLSLWINVPFDEFAHVVRVDGVGLVEGRDYVASSGSTIVRLRASYLKTLGVGGHAIVVGFTGRVPAAVGSFTVTRSLDGYFEKPAVIPVVPLVQNPGASVAPDKSATAASRPPKTGAEGLGVPFPLLPVLGVALVGVLAAVRRRLNAGCE
jgi:hypothetical protein